MSATARMLLVEDDKLPAVAGEVARVRQFLEVTLEPAATRDPDATKVEW